MLKADFPFKARIVYLILSKKPDEALERLSEYYNVQVPKVKIGMPKGHVKNRGCYVVEKKTIYFSNYDSSYNPYVVLHEFYHHLRTKSGKHKGTEKLADAFAKGFLEAYKDLVAIHNHK
jgi:Mlc titration factor MtfA (ptsG expression regulator)